MDEIHKAIQRLQSMPPEEILRGLREVTEKAEKVNAERARAMRLDWRTLHEPMTI